MGSAPFSSLDALPAPASGPPISKPQILLEGADPPAERPFEKTVADGSGSPVLSEGSAMRVGFRADVAPFLTLRGLVMPALPDGVMGLAITAPGQAEEATFGQLMLLSELI